MTFRSSLSAVALAGAALCCAHPASAASIQIVSQALTPPMLGIPSTGFLAPVSFRLDLTVRATLADGEVMRLTRAMVDLYEDDVAYDDLVTRFDIALDAPLLTASQNIQIVSVPLTVAPALLNSQCAGGCVSGLGRWFEDGALEFRATSDLAYTVSTASAVPEPSAAWLAAAGAAVLGLALRRRSKPA